VREVALKDEESARLWWLHCNLSGPTPDTSWTVFTDIVRPLVRIADEKDPVTRLARTLLTMNDYYQGRGRASKRACGRAAAQRKRRLRLWFGRLVG
jgi:hypothetical protein